MQWFYLDLMLQGSEPFLLLGSIASTPVLTAIYQPLSLTISLYFLVVSEYGELDHIGTSPVPGKLYLVGKQI
jgi:hypothetical protein